MELRSIKNEGKGGARDARAPSAGSTSGGAGSVFTVRRLLLVTALSLLSPYLADLVRCYSVLYANRAAALPELNTFSFYQTRFHSRLRNCEDAVLDEERGFAILSCDPGRDTWNTVMGTFIDPTGVGNLYLWRYAQELEGSGADVNRDDTLSELRLEGFKIAPEHGFHPLGLTYDAESGTLYVINHAEPASTVEVFLLDAEAEKARHVRSFAHALLPNPNAVTVVPGTGGSQLYVSSTHEFSVHGKSAILRQLVLASRKLETFLGVPSGSVVHVDLKTGEATRLAQVAFTNGVSVINSTTLAVASSGRFCLYIYDIQDPKNILLLSQIKLPFIPDNVKTDSSGKLMIGGHPSIFPLADVSENNHKFYADKTKTQAEIDKVRKRSPSWVSIWDGKKPDEKPENLLVGWDIYGMSATAVRDVKRKAVMVFGLYQPGILLARQ